MPPGSGESVDFGLGEDSPRSAKIPGPVNPSRLDSEKLLFHDIPTTSFVAKKNPENFISLLDPLFEHGSIFSKTFYVFHD